MAKSPVSLFWFRRDLRLKDNHGLHQALSQDQPVIPLFIFDPQILGKLKDPEDKRVQFIYETLQGMDGELRKQGKALHVCYGQPRQVFASLLKKYAVTAVYTNRDYEPYALRRDEEVESLLKTHNVPLLSFKDQCVFEKSEVNKSDGTPYTVFTPYKKKWLQSLSKKDLQPFPSETLLRNLMPVKSPWPSLSDMGFRQVSFSYPAKTVQASLLKNYDKTRDYPEVEGTSRLGLHLRFGTISVRRAVEIAKKTNLTWLSELIWREFFMQILYHFPHVEKGAFRKNYDKIVWRNNKEEFLAWCEGRTGYPIVDAGMRELNATGYMHNRVRMITASFLTKDLLVDWRWGEAYFAEKLLDFDLSANNGNWQWAAGTGCDAAPYFRIFNPESQMKKFDPDLEYIKKWIPELGSPAYPKPIVDHQQARLRTLKAYKKALGK